MRTFLQSTLIERLCGIMVCLCVVAMTCAQQLPNAGFEDWSGAQFKGEIQPASWNVSNVTQLGVSFGGFAHQEAGHSGSYSIRVQDQTIGAMGVTETSPGYFSLGQPWVYISSITAISSATAGTSGGINWTYRPDSMSVWIKRTGNNWADEDFYLLYYAWSGTASGSKYMGKNGSCTENVYQTDEESDIRIALDGNECGTDVKGNQIAEGMWRERKEYGDWTNIRVPIYYFGNDVPTKMNIIFSAGNYPNYRANSGLYDGNSLWVDDVELIYSSKIQKIYIDDKEWKAFDPNSTAEQVYSLGQSATTLPKIEAKRGIGTLTNARGESATFAGRTLSGSEITIVNGVIDGTPTTITVRAEDGSSTTTYKIKFVRAASTNSKLAGLSVNGEPLASFNPNTYSYNVELPYGTTSVPVVAAEKAEDGQTVSITQPTSTSGTATIRVTAADQKTTSTYTISFSVALLADNTLEDILVNGKSIPGYVPTQTIYRVSLPTSTTTMPSVQGVSKYPAGAQTITYTAPSVIDGGVYQVAVTTPGNQVPKTYKLTFKLEASSYSYLNDLQMGGYITDFQPEQLTYYVTLPMGTTALPPITYELGDEYQTVSISEGGLDGTTRVTVTAANGDETIYKIVVTTLKSDVATLNNIWLDGVPLEGFDPATTQYSVTLPVGTTALPEITYEQGDEFQTVSVVKGALNGTTRITVTAGDGTTMVYQITFSVVQATNNTLKMIQIDGVDLEGFSPDILEYTINLPIGTTTQPVVTYTPNDEYQTITVRAGSLVTDDYRITVKPQSGASQTYILHFTVATSGNTALSMIYIDNQPLAGFHPDTLNYEYALPEGVSTIPSVLYDKAETTQKVLSLLEDTVLSITVTAENGEKRVYTITFIIKKSANAFLNMIYLDGDSLSGFEKETLDYSVALVSETCPQITVDKEETQQVMITAPYAEGTAYIRVQPEVGAANIYTVRLTRTAAAATVQLQDLLVGGLSVPGFEPSVVSYEVPYEGVRPEVTYVAGEGQTVQMLSKQDTVMLFVSDGQASTTYRVVLRRTLNADATLAGILLDGAALDGFAAATTDYTVTLPAGSALPVVTYLPANASQSVFMTQTAADEVSILVRAESGAEATYTLTFDVALYGDATLLDLQVEGMDIDFTPSQTEYALSLDEGAALPRVTYTPREGQTVVVSEADNSEQHILVRAQDGSEQLYTIRYARVLSSNALLSDILIDGVSLEGFDANVFAYTDTLPLRSRVVPSVFAVGQLPTQTITTYFSAVDGVTTIRVQSPDGSRSQDYTIAFPTRKSANAALEELYLNDDVLELPFHPDTLHYVVLMPYQAAEAPQVVYVKGETEQTVEMISRPLGETTEIKVTAEDGTERTYTILFQKQYSASPNLLKSLRIKETGESLSVGSLDAMVSLPFGTKSLTVEYEKAFDEQTVWVQPGGVTRPTIITLRSNRPSEEDAVYTLTPDLDIQDPATLESITIDGVPLAGFERSSFTYICNRASDAGTPRITTVQPAGMQMTITSGAQHWQAQVTKEGRTNTYTIYFRYPGETVNDNSTLTSIYVNGVEATKEGNAFSIMLSDREDFALPQLRFVGESPYQTQSIAWTDNGIIRGRYVRTATITNYAENGTFTTYTLEVARPLDTRSSLSGILVNGVALEGFAENTTAYTVHLASGSPLPSVQALPVSGTQKVTHTLTGNTLSVKVTPESGGSKTYTLALVYDTSDDTSLQMISNVPGFDPAVSDYVLTAATMPDLNFVKATDAQTVTLSRPAPDKATIVVRAENGDEGTYTITLQQPAATTTGQLQELELDGNIFADFASDTYDYTRQRPTLASFTRVNDQDSVVFVQGPASMQWQVFGTETHTYTLIYSADLSDNAYLAAVLLNGTPWDDFLPSVSTQTIVSDTVYSLTFVRAEETQQVSVAFDPVGQQYDITVTAEDGTSFDYHILLQTPVSSDATLRNIYVNGTPLADFAPARLTYTITIPTGATKAYEPSLPSITVEPNHSGQQIELVVGHLNATTYLSVTAQDGATTNQYELLILSEPSHCADLTGIIVNGAPLANFEAGRHYYSAQTTEGQTVVDWASDDAFQTVETRIEGSNCILHVVAQDGVNTTDYAIELFEEPLSNDATLANIWLDGKAFNEFEPDLNPRLVFSPMQQAYTIHLPAGTTRLPDVTASLMMSGQEVETLTEGMNVLLNVTAPDALTTNRYTLAFDVPVSTNANVAMIYIDGDSLDTFRADEYYYMITLPVGVRTVPEVFAQKAESGQTLAYTLNEDTNNPYVTITVRAEDGQTKSIYTIAFAYTLSTADTLQMIYADGEPLQGFAPRTFDYAYTLPVGTTDFPELSWETADRWQTVRLDTVSATPTGMARRITVAAENGASNTYNIYYDILLSGIDTLQMIYIDDRPLEGFRGDSTDYVYTYKADAALPRVYYVEGDPAQTVRMTQELASPTASDSIVRIEVTAPNGNRRTYTVYFERELSNDATLSMIYIGGDPLTGFDEEKYSYRIPLPVEVTVLPVVTAEKGHEAQRVDIQHTADTVRINVWAEDLSTATYTLVFEHLKSSNTLLADLQLRYENDPDMEVAMDTAFTSTHYDYRIALPYGITDLPAIIPVKSEEEQTVEIAEPVSVGDKGQRQEIVEITVTAPNGEDQAAYTLTFTFALNNDASLTAIYLRDELLDGFHTDSLEYTIIYPVRSTMDDFATPSDVRASLSDTLATLDIVEDQSGTILLNVTAQDGTGRTYAIHQSIELDTDNTLSMIYLNDVPLENFDPAQDFYTYYLVEGMTAPVVTAEAASDLAEISIKEVSAGDTCVVICTSEAGESRRYQVWFAISDINEAATPTPNDVLIKRISGSYQVLVATTRKDVSICFYDIQGKLISMQKVPTADPNDVQLAPNAYGYEVLMDVNSLDAGVIINLNPNEIYFYTFFVSDKNVITSGKMVLL